MFKSGYYITAELKVIDTSKISEARHALEKLCELTKTEPGCSIFQLHYDSKESTRFLLWECFDDEAAFEEHFKMDHTKEYVSLGLTEVVQYFQTDIA